MELILNEHTVRTSLPPGALLLDFIRYHKRLTGTKIGCREGDCGACTVLIGELVEGELRYRSVTSCLTPLGNVNGKHVVTVEGLNLDTLNPIQQAMCEEGATQCGFCTPGFVVSLAGFCLRKNGHSYADAIAAMDGNICRCTGYKSIERAAQKVAALMQQNTTEDPISYVTQNNILPAYFTGISARLEQLRSPLPEIANPTAAYVGGGTDLYVQKHGEMVQADIHFALQDERLKGIYIENNTCHLGAACTVADLMNSPAFNGLFPRFKEQVKLVSSTPIRNMATLAGNLVNASPIGDFAIFFLALDARLLLNDGKNKREIPLKDFYKGYKQLDKTPEEFVEKIRFPVPDPQTLFHFEKVSKRTHLDIASVNSAICLRMEKNIISSAGISAGGVSPVPLFLTKTSAFLVHKTPTPVLILEANQLAQSEIAPISDTRGSSDYKRLLLRQLLFAHFHTLFPHIEMDQLVHAS